MFEIMLWAYEQDNSKKAALFFILFFLTGTKLTWLLNLLYLICEKKVTQRKLAAKLRTKQLWLKRIKWDLGKIWNCKTKYRYNDLITYSFSPNQAEMVHWNNRTLIFSIYPSVRSSQIKHQRVDISLRESESEKWRNGACTRLVHPPTRLISSLSAAGRSLAVSVVCTSRFCMRAFYARFIISAPNKWVADGCEECAKKRARFWHLCGGPKPKHAAPARTLGAQIHHQRKDKSGPK